MNEWVWSVGGMILTGVTEVLGEKHYTAWVVDEWMSMEHWWNDTDRGNWSTGRKTLYSVGGRWMNEYGALVEWYWQGKPTYCERNFSQCLLCTINPKCSILGSSCVSDLRHRLTTSRSTQSSINNICIVLTNILKIPNITFQANAILIKSMHSTCLIPSFIISEFYLVQKQNVAILLSTYFKSWTLFIPHSQIQKFLHHYFLQCPNLCSLLRINKVYIYTNYYLYFYYLQQNVNHPKREISEPTFSSFHVQTTTNQRLLHAIKYCVISIKYCILYVLYCF